MIYKIMLFYTGILTQDLWDKEERKGYGLIMTYLCVKLTRINSLVLVTFCQLDTNYKGMSTEETLPSDGLWQVGGGIFSFNHWRCSQQCHR